MYSLQIRGHRLENSLLTARSNHDRSWCVTPVSVATAINIVSVVDRTYLANNLLTERQTNDSPRSFQSYLAQGLRCKPNADKHKNVPVAPVKWVWAAETRRDMREHGPLHSKGKPPLHYRLVTAFPVCDALSGRTEKSAITAHWKTACNLGSVQCIRRCIELK